MIYFFNSRIKLISFVLLFNCLFLIGISSKSQKNDEKRLQFGLGISISTNNIYDMYENYMRNKAIENGDDYSYPGINAVEQMHIQSLNSGFQRAILTSYMLRSMEYGVHFRILWNILMAESEFIILPSNNNYDQKIDFMINGMLGVRVPYFIMPYFIAGPNITVSFDYNGYETDKENVVWYKAVKENTSFNIGMNFRLGLDFKFRNFSFGGYYQYTIKDFREFGYLYSQFADQGISANEIGSIIFKDQSRFGIDFTWYISAKQSSVNINNNRTDNNL